MRFELKGLEFAIAMLIMALLALTSTEFWTLLGVLLIHSLLILIRRYVPTHDLALQVSIVVLLGGYVSYDRFATHDWGLQMMIVFICGGMISLIRLGSHQKSLITSLIPRLRSTEPQQVIKDMQDGVRQ